MTKELEYGKLQVMLAYNVKTGAASEHMGFLGSDAGN